VHAFEGRLLEETLAKTLHQAEPPVDAVVDQAQVGSAPAFRIGVRKVREG
jgi:hypothetical protein